MNKPTTYIMTDGSPDIYKIGQTNDDVESRRKQLQVGNPRKLAILSVTRAITEMQLHKWFDKYRAEGEWFEIPKDEINKLLKAIETLNSFDKGSNEKIAGILTNIESGLNIQDPIRIIKTEFTIGDYPYGPPNESDLLFDTIPEPEKINDDEDEWYVPIPEDVETIPGRLWLEEQQQPTYGCIHHSDKTLTDDVTNIAINETTCKQCEIDDPIIDIIILMNDLGFKTKYSCCGFDYPGQQNKNHARPYIVFIASFDDVVALYGFLQGFWWTIEYEGTVEQRYEWRITRNSVSEQYVYVAWDYMRDKLNEMMTIEKKPSAPASSKDDEIKGL
jgi:hypothetical protein